MIADMIVDYSQHLESGRVWKVEVEIPIELEEEDEHLASEIPSSLMIDCYVIAPDRDLADYIAKRIYPDYLSVCIGDDPELPA